MLRLTCSAVLLFAAANVSAGPPHLAFKSGGPGLYEFDTGAFRGRLKADGHYQGLYPMVDSQSHMELVHAPGIFSFYRVLERNKRHGECARDWPTQTKLLADGAVEVRWLPAAEHPVEIVGVYRWKTPDTLDLEVTVTPQRDMLQFELFMSSYFTKTFLASVYLRPDAQTPPRFVPVDRKPSSTGGYVMFPRDDEAVRMIQDGRWKLGSNPVDWAIERWLAAPILMRRDASHGLVALMMCPPGDCFAISSPWNPAAPDGGGYRSIYLSLFGRDLPAGKAAHARCRLIVARGLTDEQAVQRYEDYVRETRQ